MSYPYPPPASGPTAGPNVPPYGPAGFAPPPYDPRLARAAQLAESARNWLIVCAVGWFVGFMWITGPLGWYQANQLKRDFETLGMAPPSDVSNLRLLGIVTTVLVAVSFLFVVGFLVLIAVGIAANGAFTR